MGAGGEEFCWWWLVAVDRWSTGGRQVVWLGAGSSVRGEIGWDEMIAMGGACAAKERRGRENEKGDTRRVRATIEGTERWAGGVCENRW